MALPRVGLAVRIDIGSRRIIHPADTADVGMRLAVLARRRAGHGESGYAPRRSARRGIESAARLPTLQQRGGGAFVDARRDGAAIELNAASVSGATRVRQCWGDSPICNLYDRAGLPAVPFEMRIRARQPASAGPPTDVRLT